MDEALPYVLGGGFFLVALTIFGSMIFAVTRLRALERAPQVAQTPRASTLVGQAPIRASRGPWSWGTLVLIGGVVAALGALVAYQLTPSAPPLVVKVTAYQFGWKFDYYETVAPGTPGAEALGGRRLGSTDLTVRSLGVTTTDRLTLPRDGQVLFLATSLDVIHRFSAPEFFVRRDVVPGQVTAIEVQPRHEGRFRIESDYLCGAGDGVMLAAVDVVESRVFDDWLNQARPAEVPTTPAP